MTVKVLEFKREDWRDAAKTCARLPMTLMPVSIQSAP